MATHSEIVRAFMKGNGPKKGHNIFRESFHSGNIIYSYGRHFPMAIRNDEDKMFLINGDRYSSSTAHHQSLVRSAIQYRDNYKDYEVLTVPFSIFNRAYNMEISWAHFKMIDVGQDKEICKCLDCDQDFTSWEVLNSHKWSFTPSHKTMYWHQLAPSTFSVSSSTHGTRYFISGFDETANLTNHDGYFLSELPAKPRNMAHAYEMLKPQEVKRAEKNGLKVLRQGDIFAIPTILDTRKLKRIGVYDKSERVDRYYWGTVYTAIEFPRLLETSHVASEVVKVKDKVYARGVIRHRPTEFGRSRPEHINITMGNKWHRIVRNTALASYSTGGRVD